MRLATRIPARSGAMRKEPQQQRAQVTIEALLDAAAHILGTRGWAGLTTNAVAELAGVSIGSLYQYFPNKLAVIEAVRRRHFEQVLGVLRAAADIRTPRQRRIAALVDGMIAIHSRHPAAHRVLLEESPRGADLRGMHDRFAEQCRRGYEALFRANCRAADDEVSVGALILAGAVAGAVHEAAHRGVLASAVFRRAFITLVGSFLSNAVRRGRCQLS
jgi:AcrR family transcriptional regulator